MIIDLSFMKNKISLYLRVATAILILFSVGMIYYTKIILTDYDILENPDGPTLEE